VKKQKVKEQQRTEEFISLRLSDRPADHQRDIMGPPSVSNSAARRWCFRWEPARLHVHLACAQPLSWGLHTSVYTCTLEARGTLRNWLRDWGWCCGIRRTVSCSRPAEVIGGRDIATAEVGWSRIRPRCSIHVVDLDILRRLKPENLKTKVYKRKYNARVD
jgi:hypothetical protein